MLTYERSEQLSKLTTLAFKQPPLTGLDSPAMKAKFLSKMCKLSDFQDRLAAAVDNGQYALSDILQKFFLPAVQSALRDVGVAFPATPTDTHLMKLMSIKDVSGSFSHYTWRYDIDQGVLGEAFGKKPEQRKPALISLCNTVYHETRHAEQFYRILRFLAGAGWPLEQIAETTQIRREVIQQALKEPLKLPEKGWTPEAAEAREWFESLFGNDAKERKDTIRFLMDVKIAKLKVEVAIQTEKVNKMIGMGDEEQWKSLVREYKTLVEFSDVADEEYRALPEEVDAWRVGDEMGEGVKSHAQTASNKS